MKRHYVFLLFLCGLLACDNEPKIEISDLTFKSPALNQRLFNDIEITLVVSTTTPLKKTDFYLDGQIVGVPTLSTAGAVWVPRNVSAGNHTLTAVSLTAQNNIFRTERTVTF